MPGPDAWARSRASTSGDLDWSPVSKTRRLLLIGFVIFVGFVVYHGLRSSKWTSIDEPSPGVRPTTVTFNCGAPWGHSKVQPTKTLPPYRVNGTPCGTYKTDRVMLTLDVFVGVAAIAVLLAWPRHHLHLEPA